MKLYIAEHLENEYVIGAFTTLEQAKAECEKIAIQQSVRPEWRGPLPEDEQEQWCGYQYNQMTFYVCMRYLNNEFTD